MRAAPPAAGGAEELLEKIAEPGAAEMELEILERLRAAPRTPRALFPARRRTESRTLFPTGAELVVFFALVRVAENFVRLVDFFEFFLGSLFVFGDIGVVLAGEFTKCLANILLAGVARDTPCVVIILKFVSPCSAK